MKNTITITLLSFMISFSSAFSQEIGKHSVYLGISPFGGGINIANAKNIIKSVSPYGIDISRSLKDNKNYLCNNRLKKILKILNFAA